MPVPRITLWALSGAAAPSECGAPPRASGARPRRQGWRPVTRQAALSTRWYLRRLWAWRRGRRPAAAAPAAPPMRRGGSAPAKHSDAAVERRRDAWEGAREQRACRISTLGRFDGGGSAAGAEGETGMMGGMFISASSSSYPSSPSSPPSEPSSIGPAPSSCERKNSFTASSRLPPALCRKNWACSGGQPVVATNSATCSSISAELMCAVTRHGRVLRQNFGHVRSFNIPWYDSLNSRTSMPHLLPSAATTAVAQAAVGVEQVSSLYLVSCWLDKQAAATWVLVRAAFGDGWFCVSTLIPRLRPCVSLSVCLSAPKKNLCRRRFNGWG